MLEAFLILPHALGSILRFNQFLCGIVKIEEVVIQHMSNFELILLEEFFLTVSLYLIGNVI